MPFLANRAGVVEKLLIKRIAPATGLNSFGLNSFGPELVRLWPLESCKTAALLGAQATSRRISSEEGAG
jgi:hypothetical protein